MHDYYLWEVQQHEKFQVRTHVMENGLDAIVLWSFFVGPLLSVPLIFLPAVWRGRRRLLIVTAGSMIVALAVNSRGTRIMPGRQPAWPWRWWWPRCAT